MSCRGVSAVLRAIWNLFLSMSNLLFLSVMGFLSLKSGDELFGVIQLDFRIQLGVAALSCGRFDLEW